MPRSLFLVLPLVLAAGLFQDTALQAQVPTLMDPARPTGTYFVHLQAAAQIQTPPVSHRR